MKKLLCIVLVTLNSFMMKAQVNFQPYVTQTTGSSFKFVDSGDIDGDGDSDVVGATESYFDPSNDYMLCIWINNNGILAEPIKTFYNSNSGATGITVANIDNVFGDEIILILGNEIKVWKYHSPTNIVNMYSNFTGIGLDCVSVGDVDHDGKSDIAVSHWSSPWITVLYNENNNFSFTKIDYPMMNAGYDQILVDKIGTDKTNSIIYMRGQGMENDIEIIKIDTNRAVSSTNSLNLSGSRTTARGIAIGDLQGNHQNTIAITSGGSVDPWISITNNKLELSEIIVQEQPETIVYTNINNIIGDEMLVLHPGYGLSITDKNGTQSQYKFPTASHYSSTGMTTGDFNSDGKIDIAIANGYQGLVILYNTTSIVLSTDSIIKNPLELKLYPNPTIGKIFVSGLEEKTSASIIDISGKLLSNSDSDHIDLSAYSNGLYFIKILNQTYKIIKE